jgi:serine/threonine-protein kinase HipA
MSNLDLFLHNRFVGTVEPDGRDKTRVVLNVEKDYRDDILLSESFATLPGRRPPTDAVSNFLGGYVPEGNHREAMAAKRRIDKDNLFELLREFGGSIAGAVTLREPGERKTYRPSYELLDNRALAMRLKQALDDSDQAAADDSRSALPGFQPKVLVALVDGQWAYPHGRAHSTHILKPQVPARPHRIFDEHYSHLLTQRIGLARYASEIRKAGQMTYLAIERFDRTTVDGRVRPHHQEDFSQVLNLDWRDTDVKFQEPARPGDPKRASAKRIAEALGSIPGGDAAVDQWIRQLTYHVAIGNNDAHSKNVALMHLPTGTELAQVYDALPNFFETGRISWNLALAIDGTFDLRRLSVDKIIAETYSWGIITPARASSVVVETLHALDVAVASIKVPKGVSDGLAEHVQWAVGRLLAGVEISEPKA